MTFPFYLIFLATILVTRVFLFLLPTSSPEILGFQTHHYMSGALMAIFGVLFNYLLIFAIGLGLFVDELTAFVLLGGENHADNYSTISLLGTFIASILVYKYQDRMVKLHMPYFFKYMHGNRQSRKISLTLDDGPSIYTPEFLKILDEEKIKATFFVIPENLKAFPELGRAILEKGHEIGLHAAQSSGFNAVKAVFKKVDTPKVETGERTIQEVTGKTPRLFRPSPEMAFGIGLVKILKKRNLLPILASAYSRAGRSVQKQIKNITGKLRGGDIILLHDGHDLLVNSPRPQKDLEVLKRVIETAKERGLEFVKVSELIGERPYLN